jgi:hypothetical protein
MSKYNLWFESESKIPSNINFQIVFENPLNTVGSICGDVQGGKTNIALKLAHKCMLNNYPVIFIILDRDNGKIQLQTRLEKYNKDFQKWCFKNDIEYIPIKYIFVKDCKDSNILYKYLKKDMVISYINSTQLSKIFLPKKYLLITDEVDYAIKQPECKVSEFFQNICKNAKCHLGITATSFKFWHEDLKVDTNMTFKLERHEYYKGIDDVSFKYPIDEKIFSPSQENDCLETDEGFKSFLSDIENIGIYKNIKLDTQEQYTQPPIVLYVPSSFTKHHNEVFNYIKSSIRRRSKWIVIQFDGQNNCPIKLFCSEFDQEMIKIKNNTYKPKNNIYYIDKNSLSDVLGFLRHIMNLNYFYKNILIVAGRMATRQISYVCNRYLWHLSHLRILRSKTCSCTELVQSLRIFGIFKDNMPLTLSCRENDFNDIKKYIYFQDHIIHCTKLDKKNTTMYEEIFGENSIFEKHLVPQERLDKTINKAHIKLENTIEGEYKIILLNNFKPKTKIYKYIQEIIKIIIDIGCNRMIPISIIDKRLCTIFPNTNINNIRGETWTNFRKSKLKLTNDTNYINENYFLYNQKQNTVKINILI